MGQVQVAYNEQFTWDGNKSLMYSIGAKLHGICSVG